MYMYVYIYIERDMYYKYIYIYIYIITYSGAWRALRPQEITASLRNSGSDAEPILIDGPRCGSLTFEPRVARRTIFACIVPSSYDRRQLARDPGERCTTDVCALDLDNYI